jgi:agmatinase
MSRQFEKLQRKSFGRRKFLGIEEPELCSYENARFVIQSAPYEHTSSYLEGSSKGPAAILEAYIL